MSFKLKGFSIVSSCSHFVQQSGMIFSKFGRRPPKENFCEIILKSVHWSRRRCHLKVFLLLALAAILFSGERNFGRGLPKEHFCEIILKLVHWSRRRSHLKVFLFVALAVILFS